MKVTGRFKNYKKLKYLVVTLNICHLNSSYATPILDNERQILSPIKLSEASSKSNVDLNDDTIENEKIENHQLFNSRIHSIEKKLKDQRKSVAQKLQDLENRIEDQHANYVSIKATVDRMESEREERALLRATAGF